jgi:phosphohistidine phosphatase
MSANARGRTRTPADVVEPGCVLYLVRHAIAAERGDKYPDDRARPLTKNGVAKMRRAARGFARIRPEIDVVLTSPLVRARHTAEILVAELARMPRLEQLEALAPGHAPADVADALGAYAGTRGIALVGHEPDLGRLAAWLIGAMEPLPFRKGGIACIDVAALPPGRSAQLRWFATPRMLRALE